MSKIDEGGALNGVSGRAPVFTVASALSRSWAFFGKNPIKLIGLGFLSLSVPGGLVMLIAEGDWSRAGSGSSLLLAFVFYIECFAAFNIAVSRRVLKFFLGRVPEVTIAGIAALWIHDAFALHVIVFLSLVAMSMCQELIGIGDTAGKFVLMASFLMMMGDFCFYDQIYLAERPAFFQSKRRRALIKSCGVKLYGLRLISYTAVFAAAFFASRVGWILFGYRISPASLAWLLFWTAIPLTFSVVLMNAIYCEIRASEDGVLAEVFD